jgi:gas vesicle protein
MHMRRKKASWLQSAADRVTDPSWRQDVVGQASDKAGHLATEAAQLATEVARRSTNMATDLGSQVGERMNEVAHNVSDEAHGLLADSKKPRRHRLRNLFVLTGAGALAAYFFDPENGSERRTNARRRTSTSARHLANGLDRAAHAAYEAADVAATEPTSRPVPPNARTAESVHRDSVTATH